MSNRADPEELDSLRRFILNQEQLLSRRAIAGQIGMSVSAVTNFLEGSVPYSRILGRLRRWRAARESFQAAESPVVAAAADFEVPGLRGVVPDSALDLLGRWAVLQGWRYAILLSDMHRRSYKAIALNLGIPLEQMRDFLAGGHPHRDTLVALARFRPSSDNYPPPGVLAFGALLSACHASGCPATAGAALQARLLDGIRGHFEYHGVPYPDWLKDLQRMLEPIHGTP